MTKNAFTKLISEPHLSGISHNAYNRLSQGGQRYMQAKVRKVIALTLIFIMMFTAIVSAKESNDTNKAATLGESEAQELLAEDREKTEENNFNNTVKNYMEVNDTELTVHYFKAKPQDYRNPTKEELENSVTEEIGETWKIPGKEIFEDDQMTGNFVCWKAYGLVTGYQEEDFWITENFRLVKK